LPPSGENELASRGFVKFRCKPIVDSPLGSVISNSADLYLNSATPKKTNQTDHKIGENFIQIMTPVFEKGYENLSIKAVPNPFSETVFIEFENADNQTFHYDLTDISGRKIRSGSIRNSFEIGRNHLTSGLYFLTLKTAENLPIATLKIVCKK